MSTIKKALQILELFSEAQPQLRVAEIARQLDWDKSNVQRYVGDLAGQGLLEQDPRDKSYFLGSSVTRLAMLRDRTHPRAAGIVRILQSLVEKTGETAHASQYIDGKLQTTSIEETKIRGTRVYIDPSEALPFHASGSGLAFLSKVEPQVLKQILSAKLERYTEHTPVKKKQVLELIVASQQVGYSKMVGGFESDVVGLAAPMLNFDDLSVGAVAVAMPAARFNSKVERQVAKAVIDAANEMSQLFGKT